MTDTRSDCSEADAPARSCSWAQRAILGAVCALVIVSYAFAARPGYSVPTRLNPSYDYYNLLVDGFRAGQLGLKLAAPPGLAQLADPYDPDANARYQLLDMSYYKGRLYLYFGVTPALVLFWPYAVLTGHYLVQKNAVVIFCSTGFLACAWLLHSLWRRCFAGVSVAVVAIGTLALGLASGTLLLLARSDVYEVSISCGYALSMLALAAIWKALHDSSHRAWWLAAASVAFGLAVGARPTLLVGAVILVVPVIQAWRERRPIGGTLAAALGPIALIGVGLMFYNYRRFDDPLEFGWHYQLSAKSQVVREVFSPRFLWFNFRVYFLEPVRWTGRFPFVREPALPRLPAGYGQPMNCLGVLVNIPVVWLALAVALLWRTQPGRADANALRWFTGAVGWQFAMCALALGMFRSSNPRYELDFLPGLVLLAAIGILALERALAGCPRRRRAMRWVWGFLLCFSVAFNLCAGVERGAEAHNNSGRALLKSGNVPGAIAQFDQALRLWPDFAEAHNNLGGALWKTGDVRGAIDQFERALRVEPDDAAARYNLGVALEQDGRIQEAIGQYEHALRINPDFVEARNALAQARAAH